MSAFTEGQEVTVTGDTQDYGHGFRAGATATVVSVDGSPSTYVEVDGTEAWVANLDLEAATPAPFDPSKVKAGDTVTVTDGKHTIAGVVDSVRERAAQFWFRFRFGEQPDAYYEVPMALARSEAAFTLTVHQPAPEPEPEWKPGTVAEVEYPQYMGDGATLRVRAVLGSMGWHPFADPTDVLVFDEMTAVRPLVVIDPAAARRVVVDALAAVLSNDVDYEALSEAADAVTTALRSAS